VTGPGHDRHGAKSVRLDDMIFIWPTQQFGVKKGVPWKGCRNHRLIVG